MKLFFQLLGLFLWPTCTIGEDENYYKSFSECADSAVIIEEMSMTCDSPGAYYDGGSNYRNSATCVGGDKGRLKLSILIAEDLVDDALLDISAKGYGSVEKAVIRSGASLCQSLTSVNGAKCPAAGYYKFHDTFYWAEQSDDAFEYSFSPKVSVGIKSSESSNVYDLGGINTDFCSGNVITNWSAGFRKAAGKALQTFVLTFGILLGAILFVLAFVFCVVRQSKSNAKVMDEDEEHNNDYQKMAMVGNNATLVDA